MKQKTAQYMAGLFDAEGSFTINGCFRKASNCLGYTAQIIFTNTDLRLLKWITKHFGGVYKTRRNCPGKQAYDWKITNQKHALSFLSIIEPYLVVKKQEAALMMEYYALNGAYVPERRKKLAEEIKVLKWNRGSVTTDMPNVSTISNAYFAGFVEGDGHISPTPTLHATNTNAQVIELFKQKYGGTVAINRMSRFNPKWNDVYVWGLVNAEKVERVLVYWLPYLIGKRESALRMVTKLRLKMEAKIQSELTGDCESDIVGTLIS